MKIDSSLFSITLDSYSSVPVTLNSIVSLYYVYFQIIL